ncbi:MAG: hypothetical protein IPH88_16875 [Bacteroidales bacterium]|nr:hypothetical protein [Bacteroidales bacterium]
MKTMLKVTSILAIAILFAIESNAQNASPVNSQSQTKVSTGNGFVPGTFVDKDNNGVCDNFESRGNAGRGRSFTDKDRDGICDNKGNKVGRGRGQGNNCRYGTGNRGNRGRGNGYCRRNTSN